MKRSGRKSAAQTPAPAKDRVYGSKKNPKGSASSKASAVGITLSDSITKTLEGKRDEFNSSHPSKKVSLPTLKAIMRRGMGAYSTSYRPTITGGAPNSRQAWGFARVNKFLLKKGGTKVKAAYVQDDDLMKYGGEVLPSVRKFYDWFINWYKDGKIYEKMNIFISIPNELTNIDTKADSVILDLFEKIDQNVDAKKYMEEITSKADEFGVSIYLEAIPRYKHINSELKKEKISSTYLIDYYKKFGFQVIDKVLMKRTPKSKLEAGGQTTNTNKKQVESLIEKGIVDLKFYETTPEHAKEYGIQSNKPLYVQNLIVLEKEKVLDYLEKYASENGNDVIFGYLADKSSFSKDSKQSFYSDIDTIKNWLHNNGYAINNETNEFHKVVKTNIKYEDGGKMGKDITCVNCGWHWNTSDSDESDKYVCHKCGFNNRTFYDSEPIDEKKKIALPDTYTSYDVLKPILERQGYTINKNDMELPIGKLAKGMNLSEVAAIHGLEANALKSELVEGVEREMEHTDKPEYARAIALDHLYEDPKYYTKMKKMEGMDKHLESITKKYAEGGKIDKIFSFETPTKEPSKLTYLQQVLVRTKSFKDFFGDWELAARKFRSDRDNFLLHYKDVSKIIDPVTLEPKVLYHGTRTEQEFFRFDVTKEKGVGRPYGYFAVNKEYSENFTTSSQRGHSSAKPFLYEVFLNVRKPFMALGQQYENKNRDADSWMNVITGNLLWDNYRKVSKDEETKGFIEGVESQIFDYIKATYTDNAAFWRLMARDAEKDFKFFLMAYGYNGIEYTEEFSSNFDVENPAEFTKAVTIFDSKQVKLADGRNLNFNPLIDDIRYSEGGELNEKEEDHKKEYDMNKKAKLGALLFGEKYAEGGKVVAKDSVNPNDGKRGGYFKGKSHADGGIKAYNVDTGQHIEVEGEEVIITKGAVNDTEKREFEGQMMTNREILSRINQSGGGVSFAEGGELNGDSCGCSGKKFKYGGELMEDFNILRKMNEPFSTIQKNLKQSRSFVDDLVSKMK